MPVFECSRCNELTYSSSRANVVPCQGCGSARRRIVDNAASFAEAKTIPRAVSYGDHSIAVFDQYEQVAPIAVQFIDQGLLAGGLVMVAVPQKLEELWQSDFSGDVRACDVHISNLRQKIERDPQDPELVLTVRGVGYRLADPAEARR